MDEEAAPLNPQVNTELLTKSLACAMRALRQAGIDPDRGALVDDVPNRVAEWLLGELSDDAFAEVCRDLVNRHPSIRRATLKSASDTAV